ncbi:MAG: hypothetical protein VZQ47_03745 [Treponema sp.]|nr:hypothetical protein [Treponema sp.]MEE3434653.1 hypothetical protein [Treponema sp.]
MKKNLYFVFIAASFALLIAAPGRLAYGLPLIVELNILMAATRAFYSFVKKFDMGGVTDILAVSFIVFLTAAFKQLLILFSPVIALTLSFCIYIPALSVFLLASVFQAQGGEKNGFESTFWFSVFALVFFLLRDILGYGTLSLPVPNGIKESYLFNSYDTAFLSFFATIPGALLVLLLCMSFLLTVQLKMNTIEKAGVADEDN